MSKKPNIIIIMSDEHSVSMIGASGHKYINTPNIDKLAQQGINFRNAYCNSPICVPSRLSFLTGRYVHEIGVWDNGVKLKNEIPTFAHYLEADGYETVLCGRMHMVGKDRLHGFSKRLYDDMEKWTKPQLCKRTKEERRKSDYHVTECGPGHGSWQESVRRDPKSSVDH